MTTRKVMNIDPQKETQRIVDFIQRILKEQKIEKVVLGLSGGIDSTTSLYLLAKAINPRHILPIHLPYFEPSSFHLQTIVQELNIPQSSFQTISIKSAVDVILHLRGGRLNPPVDRVRLGNIMARVRMIMLYDLAKKNNALVCGTENKSEHLLGYYTRFGDGASDFEPIRHLYKTQVYQLAEFLKVPKVIIEQKPTAGLWQGQTDEGQFGFTYQEADQVMHLYFDQKEKIEQIEQKGLKNAQKIIDFCQKNSYKHHVPYSVK